MTAPRPFATWVAQVAVSKENSESPAAESMRNGLNSDRTCRRLRRSKLLDEQTYRGDSPRYSHRREDISEAEVTTRQFGD